MTLPITTKTPIRWTPEEEAHKPDAPVYLIGVPTVRGRSAYRRRLAQEGVVYWPEKELAARAREVIDAASVPDIEDLHHAIDAFELGFPGEADEKSRLAQIWGDLAVSLHRNDPKFAAMRGDNQYFIDMVPVIAASMFLVGWENVNLPFSRDPDGCVPMEIISQIPANHLYGIWSKTREPSEAQRKNSNAPLSSPSCQETSTVASELQTEASGRSAESDTKPTPN